MVHGAYSQLDRFKTYFKFNKKEKKILTIGILSLTLTITIAQMLSETYINRNLVTTPQILLFLLTSFIAAKITVLTYELTQRAVSLEQGTKTKIKLNKAGLFIGPLSALITFGFFPILAVKQTTWKLMKGERLGHLFYGKSSYLMAKATGLGLIALIILALISNYLIPYVGNLIANVAMLYAIAQLIPYPTQDGLSLLYVRKTAYVTAITTTILFFLIVLLT